MAVEVKVHRSSPPCWHAFFRLHELGWVCTAQWLALQAFLFHKGCDVLCMHGSAQVWIQIQLNLLKEVTT